MNTYSEGNRGAKIAQPETNLYKAGIWFKMFLHIYILLRQNHLNHLFR